MKMLKILCEAFYWMEDTTKIVIGILSYFIIAILVSLITKISFFQAMVCVFGIIIILFAAITICYVLYQVILDIIESIRYAKKELEKENNKK